VILDDLTPLDRAELVLIVGALLPLPAETASLILARVILDMAGGYRFDGQRWVKRGT